MRQKKRNITLFKKILTSLMLVFLFLATCNTELPRASSKIDFYEKNENFELRIKNTPWLKRWAKGIEEGPRVSRFNGYPLKDILIKLLNEDPFRVEMRGNRVNPKLDFEFESYSLDKEEWIERIIKVLGKQLNFSIYEDKIKKEVWTITVSDSALLHNHKTALEGGGSKSAKWFFSKWEGTNQSIDELAKVIADKFKKIVLNDTGSTDGYDVQLNLRSVKKLESKLEEEYGLKLIKEEKEVECTVIEFSSKN